VSGITKFRDDDFFGSGAVVSMENPNSLSAYLGVVIPINIYFLFYGSKAEKFTNLILFFLALNLLFDTKSIQGFIIIFISVTLLLFHNFYSFIKDKRMIILGLALTLVLFLMYNFEKFSNWLIVNGSVNQRVSYWKLAIDIWQDNFWFGVGIENMRPYSILYRDLNLVNQEGITTAPDRAHNIILDHFVCGGFFPGVSWVIFVVSITALSISLYLRILKCEANQLYLCIILIWVGYLFQSLISVSPLTLTYLGYVSAGIIAGAMYQIKISRGLIEK
jgi:O-antigen ligase